MNYFLPASLLFTFALACTKAPDTDAQLTPRPENPKEIIYSEDLTPEQLPAVDMSGYTVYYADSQNGDDNNDGLSESSAFKSLKKISELPKKEGMRVRLKSGCVFYGYLVLENLHSTEKKPFILDTYGGSEKAFLDGQSVEAVIHIKDDHIRISQLDITNKNGKLGCFIEAVKAGAMRNIQISNCRFHEINWRGNQEFIGIDPNKLDVRAIDSGFQKGHGGIVADAATSKEIGPSWYENLYIKDNEFYQLSRTGFLMATRWGERVKGWGYNDFISDEEGWYPNKNVVVQGNRFEYIGGDGVILIGCLDSYIDHNTCYYANFLGRQGNASAGLWPYVSVHTIMQYNEVAYTQWANGSGDGEGLDIDIACKNTICQYNYVHHNVGGGILMCNIKDQKHSGHTVRNNVFAFNGGKEKGCFMVISSGVGQTEVYNNLVITSGSDPRIIYSDDWAGAGHSKDFSFRNNIFYSTEGTVGIFDHSHIDGEIFENNLYWNLGNFSRMDKYHLNYDPQITVPQQFEGWEKALQFKPASLPILQDGILFNGMAGKDIASNPTEGIAYLGAFAK